MLTCSTDRCGNHSTKRCINWLFQKGLYYLYSLATSLNISKDIPINKCMKTYENYTPSGLWFRLSLYNGVCCIIVYDVFYCQTDVQFFTDINKAMRYVNNI